MFISTMMIILYFQMATEFESEVVVLLLSKLK